eukprot:TRINITY_DN4290_c0_g1_i1.p1 TRINITY_DN4290_c0_g1~~TRINITY_DN4290_c0_g1_i1.p1  ORF type:complete len:805 (+),score=184.59 TRINITY_DN4290_c0_g1_i1:63-2477(+)
MNRVDLRRFSCAVPRPMTVFVFVLISLALFSHNIVAAPFAASDRAAVLLPIDPQIYEISTLASLHVSNSSVVRVALPVEGVLTFSLQAFVSLLSKGCLENAFLEVDNTKVKSFESRCAENGQVINYNGTFQALLQMGVHDLSFGIISNSVLENTPSIDFMLSFESQSSPAPIQPLAGNPECKKIESLDGSKCNFVKEFCDPNGNINYLSFHYCDMDGSEAGSFVVLFGWLGVLFYLLGSTTEGFFCPSLTVISQKLNLSPAVAGITLLALGNDAPDVFSVIAAVSNDALDLAFGEVAGSGLFVTCFILGIIVFVSDVQLSRKTFLRDSIIYNFGIILVILFFLSDGLYLYEAIILLMYYVAYVLIVFVDQYRYQKAQAAMETDPLLASVASPSSSSSSGSTSEQRPRLTRKSSKPGLRERTMSGRIKRQKSDENINRTYLGRIGVYQQINSNRDAFWRRGENKIVVTKLPAHSSSTGSMRNVLNASGSGSEKISEEHALPQMDSLNADTQQGFFSTFLHAISSSFEEIVEMIEFDKKSGVEKVLYVLEAPFIFIRAITIPRVEDGEWNRIYAFINIILSPLFFFWAFDIHAVEFGSGFLLWHFLLLFVIPMGFYYAYSTRGLSLSTPPTGRLYTTFVGIAFFMSMAWIYVIANELVSLLQSFGLILSLSEYILGVTVLAWGNSMPDLVADVVMARQGYPQMALGHCYGGPLFNLFFGLSTALVLKATETLPDPIDIGGIADEAFFVLFAVIIGGLLAMSFAFYFDFHPPKFYAYLMIGYYATITICNIAIEAGLFSFPNLNFST